jgi:hypothetical protein
VGLTLKENQLVFFLITLLSEMLFPTSHILVGQFLSRKGKKSSRFPFNALITNTYERGNTKGETEIHNPLGFQQRIPTLRLFLALWKSNPIA